VAGLLDRVLDPSLRDFNYDQRSATQLQPRMSSPHLDPPDDGGPPGRGDPRRRGLDEEGPRPERGHPLPRPPDSRDRPGPDPGGGDVEADAELVARTTAIDFQPLTDAKAEKWVARRAGQLGVALEPAATRLLLNAVEGDLGWLAAELAKLAGLGGGPR